MTLTLESLTFDNLPYDELKATTRAEAVDLDERRWRVGYAALEVGKRYGTDMFGQFLADIKVPRTSGNEWRRIARQYEKSTLCTFWNAHPDLAWSHYRTAARLKDEARAYDFLCVVYENGWSCEQAAIEMKKHLGEVVPPKTLATFAGALILDCDPSTGQITIQTAGGADWLALGVLMEDETPLDIVAKEAQA